MSNRPPRRVRVPGDKSITHRALLVSALASGVSGIHGALEAEDTASTARVLGGLGVAIQRVPPGELRVTGKGLRGLAPPGGILDCGNSGTTARLLLGVLAAQPVTAGLTGDDSLRGRPMRRVTSPLLEMGARIRELGAPDRLPLEISGGLLRSIEYHSPQPSAQVKSAVLLAGLAGGVPVAFTEPVQSRDHTERLLTGLGVNVTSRDSAAGHRVALEPVAGLPALQLTVPGDFSAAAFLIAAGLLIPGGLLIENVGVNPSRTGLLDVLARMGARIELDNPRQLAGEPVADLLVKAAPLGATSVGAREIPALIDEVPALAVLATRAEGETSITGAAELRVKESDRIAGLVKNLRAIGASVEELEDGLVIRGTAASFRGRVHTAGDHRIAMAFGVLAALPGNDIQIDCPAAVAVSFPGFWDEIAAMGAGS